MKEWESKIFFGLRLFRASTINSVRAELAYFSNNWGSVISTIVYTAAAILSTKIIFANVKLLAGYTYGEMLFMLVIAQTAFYLHSTLLDNINLLIDDVNSGNFDFILTKPVSAFYLNFIRTVPLVSTLRDCLPPLILISYFVPWSTFHISPLILLAGLIIFVGGSICWYAVSFLLALPVFWIGQAREIFKLEWRLNDAHDTPYEGYPRLLRWLLSTVIPVLLVAQLTTSVLLGKQPAILSVLFVILVTMLFSILVRLAWRGSLRNYASASS